MATGKELMNRRRDDARIPGIAFSASGHRLAINWCDFVEVRGRIASRS